MKTYIGIDNGTTGSIGIITEQDSYFVLTPTKREQNYTKKKDIITRVDAVEFKKLLIANATMVALERPFLNPKAIFFKANISAARCFENELSCVELSGLPFMFLDSKEWQREMLPQGVQGTVELKKASMDIGLRLFPKHAELIRKHKDADGLLIAEYIRRKGL